MKYPFLFIVFILIIRQYSFCQGDVKTRETMFLDSRTIGLQLSSNGFGGDFRYHKWIDNNKKRLYSVEFITIKDPKEFKISNPKYQKQFVYGKINSVFATRIGYGIQKKMFAKRDKGGIEINYFLQFGPNIKK